ncbi:MAG: tryptophan-rich sensory protein [Clostridia bacterium]|nr:tryptophan-rich sensory protein [Clostridia bacterium]
MIIKIDFKKLILSLLPPVFVGGLASLITRGDMDLYEKIKKPPLAPPGIVFPIVWSVLYILMGISFYLVWKEKKASYDEKKRAFTVYFISLFLNFIWSPVFFSLRQFLPAFIILVLLFISVAVYTTLYYNIGKAAGLLQIPYIIWLIVAAYLNLSIILLNG